MKSCKQVIIRAFLTSVFVSLLFTGCTSNENTITVSQNKQEETKNLRPEHPATQKLSATISQLGIAVSDLRKNNFKNVINQYDEHWQQMQVLNDMLKKTASLQPIDEAQLTFIKETLQALGQELVNLEDINPKLENKLKSTNMQISEINKRTKLLDEAWLEYQTVQPDDDKFSENAVNAAKGDAITAVELAEKAITETNQIAKMYNGRAKGLYNATEKYVGTFKNANQVP